MEQVKRLRGWGEYGTLEQLRQHRLLRLKEKEHKALDQIFDVETAYVPPVKGSSIEAPILWAFLEKPVSIQEPECPAYVRKFFGVSLVQPFKKPLTRGWLTGKVDYEVPAFIRRQQKQGVTQ